MPLQPSEVNPLLEHARTRSAAITAAARSTPGLASQADVFHVNEDGGLIGPSGAVLSKPTEVKK